jgi:hypothetical protein
MVYLGNSSAQLLQCSPRGGIWDFTDKHWGINPTIFQDIMEIRGRTVVFFLVHDGPCELPNIDPEMGYGVLR